jgi:deoxycytidylate deaminase
MSSIYEIDKIIVSGPVSQKVSFPDSYKLNIESTRKWMRVAKTIKEVESPCYSRSIGVVLVDPDVNALISSGHNGPPSHCPKNDDAGYLGNVVWPQLTADEQSIALRKIENIDAKLQHNTPLEVFRDQYAFCKVCPRKHIDAPSGKRLDLCTCIHGETDAIVKAKGSGSRVSGSYMFAYCGVPCIECTKLIINSHVRFVVAIDHGHGDYSPYSSRWMYQHSKVDLILVQEDWIWKD